MQQLPEVKTRPIIGEHLTFFRIIFGISLVIPIIGLVANYWPK